jgi:hypothetical protein
MFLLFMVVSLSDFAGDAAFVFDALDLGHGDETATAKEDGFDLAAAQQATNGFCVEHPS